MEAKKHLDPNVNTLSFEPVLEVHGGLLNTPKNVKNPCSNYGANRVILSLQCAMEVSVPIILKFMWVSREILHEYVWVTEQEGHTN